MKKIFYGIALLLSTTAFAATPPVDEQTSKLFKETFPSATNVKWFDYETYYEVTFENNQIPSRVKYDLYGNILSARRDYQERDLPIFIRAKVKEKYSDKKIYGVTEITSFEGVIYTIILEDDKNWITITSNEGGNLSLVQKVKKA